MPPPLRLAVALLALLLGASCSSRWEERDLAWLREIEGAVEEVPPAHAWLGLEVAPNESDSLEEIELRPGVRVRRVEPGSPASRAGIRPGDVLLRFGETRVDDPGRLESLLLGIQEPRTVSLRLERGHRVFELDVALEVQEARGRGRTLYHVERGLLRVAFRDTRGPGAWPEIALFLEESPLEEAGARTGDRVLSFQGHDPGSAAELVRRIKRELEPGAAARFRLLRSGNSSEEPARELEIECSAWDPGKVLVESSLFPLWHWERDRSQDREELVIGNLVLLSLFERDRVGGETEYCILGLISWTTGEPVLESALVPVPEEVGPR